jgi:hypothetical protein
MEVKVGFYLISSLDTFWSSSISLLTFFILDTNPKNILFG